MGYKVNAPNKEYTGVIAGVPFVKGEAITEDTWAISWFESKGYEISEVDEQESKSEDDLQSLKVDDLKKLAKEKGIEGYSDMKKDELIKALKGDE